MGSTAEERVSELDNRLLEILQSEQTAQGTEGTWGGQNLKDLKNGNKVWVQVSGLPEGDDKKMKCCNS